MNHQKAKRRGLEPISLTYRSITENPKQTDDTSDDVKRKDKKNSQKIFRGVKRSPYTRGGRQETEEGPTYLKLIKVGKGGGTKKDIGVFKVNWCNEMGGGRNKLVLWGISVRSHKRKTKRGQEDLNKRIPYRRGDLSKGSKEKKRGTIFNYGGCWVVGVTQTQYRQAKIGGRGSIVIGINRTSIV